MHQNSKSLKLLDFSFMYPYQLTIDFLGLILFAFASGLLVVNMSEKNAPIDAKTVKSSSTIQF